jgi:uncharacterized protein YndB with AHSA1/START domain
MAQASNPRTETTTKPVLVSRIFPAPRELVFQAWSSADHMKRWFSPVGYTVPEAEIDFRPGGSCTICMRSPEGQNHWSKGTYLEIVPPERLVFTSSVVVGDAPKFTAHTTVLFETIGKGTRMTVRQEYEIHDPDFMAAVAGAPEGWRTTLDKLEREIARIKDAPEHSIVHASFSLSRVYPAPPALVFQALSDPAAKARWFGGGDTYAVLERSMDIRPGGREHLSGRWANGLVSKFDALYYDVVPNERLVYTYEMHLDERKISVSLATMEIKPEGTGTRLTVTEQGAFLDGYDDAGSREHGTGFLLDKLGASLVD